MNMIKNQVNPIIKKIMLQKSVNRLMKDAGYIIFNSGISASLMILKNRCLFGIFYIASKLVDSFFREFSKIQRVF